MLMDSRFRGNNLFFVFCLLYDVITKAGIHFVFCKVFSQENRLCFSVKCSQRAAGSKLYLVVLFF